MTAAPEPETVDRVVATAEEVFGRAARPADTLYDLGGDSLLGVVLTMRLEEAFGVDLDSEIVMSGATLATIAEALTRATRP